MRAPRPCVALSPPSRGRRGGICPGGTLLVEGAKRHPFHPQQGGQIATVQASTASRRRLERGAETTTRAALGDEIRRQAIMKTMHLG
jgi:hypothetical protein